MEVTSTFTHCGLKWFWNYLDTLLPISFSNVNAFFWGMKLDLYNKVFSYLIKTDKRERTCHKIQRKLFSCGFHLLSFPPWNYLGVSDAGLSLYIKYPILLGEKETPWYNFIFGKEMECSSCLHGKIRCCVVLNSLCTASVQEVKPQSAFISLQRRENRDCVGAWYTAGSCSSYPSQPLPFLPSIPPWSSVGTCAVWI